MTYKKISREAFDTLSRLVESKHKLTTAEKAALAEIRHMVACCNGEYQE